VKEIINRKKKRRNDWRRKPYQLAARGVSGGESVVACRLAAATAAMAAGGSG